MSLTRLAPMESEQGCVPLEAVGTRLASLASDFDLRTFGFRKLSDLVRKTNAFETDHPKGGTLGIGIRPNAPVRVPGAGMHPASSRRRP